MCEWLESTGWFTSEQIDKIVEKIGSGCINVIGYLKIPVPGGEPYIDTSIMYPDDFTPIVGELGTEALGKYKVILIYCGIEIDYCPLSILIRYGFKCTSFFVIPEIPLGTLGVTLTFFSPLIVRKLKLKKTD